MKNKTVYTVIWTHYNNECGIGENDCTERMNHFSTLAKAQDYARFLTCHQDKAEPFEQSVPKRIADRWEIL